MDRWSSAGALLSMVGLLAAAPGLRSSSDATSFPRFKDIARAAGIDFYLDSGSRDRAFLLEENSGGILLIDYDNDGWLDIYAVNGSTSKRVIRGLKSRGNRLYHNNHDGTFSDVTAKAGVAGNGSWGMGGCIGDVDNNGFDDILVTNHGPNVLYLNNGEGTFQDTSRKAGIEDGNRWHSGCGFGDYDRDGDLDLHVTAYADFTIEGARKDQRFSNPSLLANFKQYSVTTGRRSVDRAGPEAYRAEPDTFFENIGGQFIDVSERSGVRRTKAAYGLAVVWGDYDNDGDLDIFVANDATPNHLFRNNGDKTFTETGVAAGVAFDMNGRPQASMGADMADYDNDGNLDIAVTSFASEYQALYRGVGRGLFTDMSARVGLLQATRPFVGWGTQFVDLNLDGYQDLVTVNGHIDPGTASNPRLVGVGAGFLQRWLLFRGGPDGVFREIGAKLDGPFADVHGSRGLAVGDLNNDGQMDLVVANQETRPSIVRNLGAPNGRWLLVKLRGTRSNRSAIGARVTLRAGGRAQIREVKSGGSYLSQSDLRLHFGLGASDEIDELAVRWPSGHVQVAHGVHANQILTIVEK